MKTPTKWGFKTEVTCIPELKSQGQRSNKMEATIQSGMLRREMIQLCVVEGDPISLWILFDASHLFCCSFPMLVHFSSSLFMGPNITFMHIWANHGSMYKNCTASSIFILCSRCTVAYRKTGLFGSLWYKMGVLQMGIMNFKGAALLSFKLCAYRYDLGLSNELLFIIIV